MALRVLTLFTCIFSIYTVSAVMKLQELFSWNVLDWSYSDELSKRVAIQTNTLIPENAIPVGIEKWKNKLFVTVPRWVGGVPATLNYIPLDTPYEPSPKLLPYPSYEENELGNCNNGLNTVYRIKADKCDRLWVLDVGTFGYDTNITRYCPPTLHVFDLNSNIRIRKYIFKAEDITPSTLITNIAIDVGASCADAFAYFSDELAYGLLVYSWETNKSWRFTHSYFMPDPLLGNYNISSLLFHWGKEGIYSIALSPPKEDGYRTLYFSPLSSHTEFSVSTRILRNESRIKKSFADFEIVGFRGPGGHLAAKVIDESGVQLFSLIDQNSIACWNSLTPYNSENIKIVDRHNINLIFPSDIKIDEERYVWVISNRMPIFIESILDYGDINFRIFTAPLNTLLEGTPCEAQTKVFPTFPLPYINIKPPTRKQRKPKSLLVPFPTQRHQVPAGIHKQNFHNTSKTLNFTIIVSSKTVHYVQTRHTESTTKNDDTTPKLIIYVNAPDYNEIPNKDVQYPDIEYVVPEMTNNYSSTFYTTTETQKRIVPKPHISNNQIKKFPNTNSPSVRNTTQFLSNKHNFRPHPPLKKLKIHNIGPLSKKTATRKLGSKIYVNLPTSPITHNKNNPFIKKTISSYKAIEVINDRNGTNHLNSEPLYDDDDYQAFTISNVAPTIHNYGNELWYIGNTSRLNPPLYTNQSIIEYDESNTEPPAINYVIPNTISSDCKIKKIDTQNNGPNKIKQHKSKAQVHHPNQRDLRVTKKYSNIGNAINHYISSPTAFPNRVNFINAGYIREESVNNLDYKPYRPASAISKRITDITNIFSNLIPRASPENTGGEANFNMNLNVFYPTTVNPLEPYPDSCKIHGRGVDIKDDINN